MGKRIPTDIAVSPMQQKVPLFAQTAMTIILKMVQHIIDVELVVHTPVLQKKMTEHTQFPLFLAFKEHVKQLIVPMVGIINPA